MSPPIRTLRLLPTLTVAVSLTLGSCTFADRPEDGTVLVAVAANFAMTHAELARRFELATGARVVSSTGGTGQLYAQIRNGAPFEVFLAADAVRPMLLEEEGFGILGTRITYAIGRLALFGPRLDSVRSNGADLARADFTNLAIANPRTAPYGVAAEAVLDRVGLDPVAQERIVLGENVGQALQFVRSGAAELGFVALSQVVAEPAHSYWLVPRGFHPPIEQDAVLLQAGGDNPVAHDYLTFLGGGEAASVIRSFGYETSRPSAP